MFVYDSAGSSHGCCRGALAFLFLCVVLAAAGCDYHADGRRAHGARAGGIFHAVKKGENLYRIGKAYGVHHATLARINHIRNARRIQVGKRLFIPGAERVLPVAIITPVHKAAPARREATARQGRGRTRNPPARPSAARRPSRGPRQSFAWPVKGKLTGRFDSRPESLNDGINIAAPPGTPVHATLAGQVLYSDRLRGYGNVIILRHRGGYASVYAHNRRNLVRQGQRVRQRQVIAEVGATGRATTPRLHFEIRRNNIARDPLSYLP